MASQLMCFSDIPSRSLVKVALVPRGHSVLKAGDILLQHGERLITKVSELYDATDDCLSLTIIRAGMKMQVNAPTVSLFSYLVSTVVWFCGARLETPHSLVRFGARDLYSNIWITDCESGSPAQKSGLPELWFITTVNSVDTKDFDDFLKLIGPLSKGRCYRIRCMSMEGMTKTVSVTPNLRDFRTLVAREDRNSRRWWYEELQPNSQTVVRLRAA